MQAFRIITGANKNRSTGAVLGKRARPNAQKFHAQDWCMLFLSSAKGAAMWKRFTILKTLFFLLASAALPALAQNSAEITGSVADTSGAVIVGVTVTITNTATNQARKVNSNAAGAYDAPYLVPGIYDVTAESPGFKVTARKAVELQVDTTVRIDFVMQVGEVSEQVEVTGGAPLVNTENASVGTVIDNKRIVELPLNGRNFLSLISLSPNVSVEAGPSSVTTLQGGLRSTQGFNVAGMRYEFNRFTLDGVENTDPNFNSYVFQPSVDAVQEFKVQSGIY